MKSLEIINKDLQDFEKALENYKKRKAINNEEIDEEYIKQMTKEIENYKQIKQDLEVLEIIRKKRVCIDALMRIIRINYEKSNEEILYDYNCLVNKIYKLTMEELLKLKQWLEVNENETNL